MSIRGFRPVRVRTGVLLSALLLGSGSLVSASANVNAITSIDVQILEGQLQEGWYRPSLLQVNFGRIAEDGRQISDEYECKELGNGDCGYGFNLKFSYSATVVYPPCLESLDGPCIEKFELRQGDGEWEEASYIRSIFAPTRNAEPSLGFPKAGSMSLWRSKSTPHAGGEKTYAIYVLSEGSASAAQQTQLAGVKARIIPFTEVPGEFPEQKFSPSKDVIVNGVNYGKRITTSQFEPFSVWSDRLGRGIVAEWSKETSARLTLRVPSRFNGWIGGRFSNVDFDLQNYSRSLNRLKISGAPVSIAEVQLSIPIKDIPQKLREIYPIKDPPEIAGYFLGGATHKISSRVLEAIRDYSKDRATRSRTFWGFESVAAGSNKCLSDSSRIVGFVSTNALTYMNTAPSFEDGRLKYSVAGMHFDEKGEVIKGNYDLVLRSDAARCLYGFTDAPVDAVVSVTYGDKEESIATSVVGEKNGWLFVSAKNFTFSSPTIEVALSQPKTTSSTSPTPTSEKTTVSSKPLVKKTIICVKSSTKKKITGYSPKCPKGYTKKS